MSTSEITSYYQRVGGGARGFEGWGGGGVPSVLPEWTLLSLTITLVGNWNLLWTSAAAMRRFICLGAALLICYKVCGDRVPGSDRYQLSRASEDTESREKTSSRVGLCCKHPVGFCRPSKGPRNNSVESLPGLLSKGHMLHSQAARRDLHPSH